MTPRVLVVDNRDSFVFTIVQYLRVLGAECDVRDRADVTCLPEDVDGVLLSPGPGHPDDTGVCLSLVHEAERRSLPLLGVCLGHQVIATAYGGVVRRAPEVVHGYTSAIHHDGTGVLSGLPSPFQATRYHSLALDPRTVPANLEVTARTDAEGVGGVGRGGRRGRLVGEARSGKRGQGSAVGEARSGRHGVIMALRHRAAPIEGVQFHPESVLSEGGHQLLGTWLGQCTRPPVWSR